MPSKLFRTARPLKIAGLAPFFAAPGFAAAPKPGAYICKTTSGYDAKEAQDFLNASCDTTKTFSIAAFGESGNNDFNQYVCCIKK